MFCNKCGNKMEDDAVFCAKCGNKPGEAQVTNIQTPQVQSVKGKKKIPMAAIMAAVIVVVIIAGVFIWLKSSGGNRNNLQAQTIVIGNGASFAIKTDGSLWAWGNNTRGQLGVGAASYFTYGGGGTEPTGYVSNDINKPTKILDSVASISQSCSGYRTEYAQCITMAIKTDGSLWGWGDDNVTKGRHIPAKIMDSVKSISMSGNGMGNVSTMIQKTDDSLWRWEGGGE